MGTGTLLVSLAGFVGAYWNRKCLIAMYLLVMAALIVILLALLILVFVVTRPDGGYGVEGRTYREYRLDGYSKWLRDNVVGNGNWGTIRRSLVEKDVCGRLGADYPTPDAFFAAHLTPLQTIAGAVMLTDGVFWLIIFPFLATDDFIFKNNLLMIAVHTVNLLCLLAEAAMNSMTFPWFRIFYVALWTSIFVLFQWTLHSCISTWWPYPFLDLSTRYSPIWYLIIGLMHLPCYTIFFLLIKLKHFLLSRWFPDSHNLRHKRRSLSILPLRAVILQVAQAHQALSN